MLHLHRAERADALVEALGDVLVSPLVDPLEAEVVSVPTRGVERWLTQRLSHRLGTGARGGDGVCANLEFPFPGRLVGDAMAAACGVEREADPWRPERAVWPLLDVVDAAIAEPWLATVAGHLGAAEAEPGEMRRSRRFSTARHIADLYDRYGVHRPAMIRSWAGGHDVTAAGAELSPHSRWQSELWRRLRDRIGTDSPAQRLEKACAAITGDPATVALPRRLSLFGLTRLPASYLDVLRALAAERDVHLFLLHPSPRLWDAVTGIIGAGAAAIGPRDEDPTAEAPANPLLRSWGRDAREMQLVLTAGGSAVVNDHRAPPPAAPATLLQRVQQAVRDDAAQPGGDGRSRPVLEPGDRSLQVHACHGRARQVEVVRDAILHLLVEDPTLEARDVIVMCPDIETFAPLVHATFGAGDQFDEQDGEDDVGDDDPDEAGSPATRPADLRVRLADRSLRQTNPVLGALSALLEVADSRVTSTSVLDFAGRDPVRRRFGLDDDDVARMKEWVAATGVRWGLDAEHRRPFKLDGVEQNTWQSGLDRVLVGVTMDEAGQRLMEGVLPLDDVDSGAIELAGRFAELVDRLHAAVGALQGAKDVGTWASVIAGATGALMATSERDAWQRSQLHRILDDMVEEAAGDGVVSSSELELSEVQALLADRLRGRPTRANFRTGHLTVCTLVPMRSVPHRVVCLLGLDDDAFPRKTGRDGDDLVAAEPFVGDGDGRSEDRQLLLDALLAATERLVITYSGHDERTNVELPPAVPVGELLDFVDATVRVESGEGGERVRDRIVVHHPLQPFDPRNFEPGRLTGTRPWSFDPVTLDGARALLGDRPAVPPFLSGPLPERERSEVVELDSLVRFVQHPVRAFLRQRLGISIGDFSEDIGETIPIELDGLEKWAVGERVLNARLAGSSAEACEAAERARGDLPPGALALEVFDAIRANVEFLVDAAVAITPADSEVDSVEVSVRLDDGRLVVGTVPGIVAPVARSVTYSKLAPKHRLSAWTRFLALSAGRPGDALEVVTLGRSDKRNCAVAVSRFAPFSDDHSEAEAIARRHLHDLVDLYDRGMCEPLPVYCATSAAYAAAVSAGKDGPAAAANAWGSRFKFDGEDKNLEHRLVLGGVASVDSLFEAEPCAGEDGEAWPVAETTRFGRYALRMWNGLLATERLEHR